MTKLEDLLEHIDYFYEKIKSDYNPEVEFTIHLENELWEVTNNSDIKEFATNNSKLLLESLIEHKADLATFHSLVKSKICTEGVLNRRQLKTIEELVGKESIDQCEKDWEGFAESLKAAITKEVNKTKLEIV